MSVSNNLSVRVSPQTMAAAVHSTTDLANAGEAVIGAAVSPLAAVLNAVAVQILTAAAHTHATVLNSQPHPSPLFGEVSDTTQFVGVHSMVGGHRALGVKPFAPGFPTQIDAADFIASQIGTSHNGPAVDLKVRSAVREACTEWKPGQDLAKLVYDKVVAALKGVLPDTKAATGLPVDVPGGLGGIFKDFVNQLPDGVDLNLPSAFGGGSPRFDYPNTAQAVAYLAARQIQANGSTVADVAEHLLNAPPSAPR